MPQLLISFRIGVGYGQDPNVYIDTVYVIMSPVGISESLLNVVLQKRYADSIGLGDVRWRTSGRRQVFNSTPLLNIATTSEANRMRGPLSIN